MAGRTSANSRGERRTLLRSLFMSCSDAGFAGRARGRKKTKIVKRLLSITEFCRVDEVGARGVERVGEGLVGGVWGAGGAEEGVEGVLAHDAAEFAEGEEGDEDGEDDEALSGQVVPADVVQDGAGGLVMDDAFDELLG